MGTLNQSDRWLQTTFQESGECQQPPPEADMVDNAIIEPEMMQDPSSMMPMDGEMMAPMPPPDGQMVRSPRHIFAKIPTGA